MEKDKKWYFVEYDTSGLEQEFFASSPAEAKEMADNELDGYGVEIEVEEMED